MLAKAEAALLAAIEIYNKPDFKYREETFAILMLNAWELLIKAKAVADNANDVRCIWVREARTLKNGRQSAKAHVKLGRSGNPITRGLMSIVNEWDQNSITRLSPAVKTNLTALLEIRDNAVHYMNANFELAEQVLSIGTASVKNFIGLAQAWFNHDLSRYTLYLMPIGFVSERALALTTRSNEKQLVAYLAQVIASQNDLTSDEYHVSLTVNLRFERSKTDYAASVALTNDPTAPKVYLTEANFKARYPWSYAQLLAKCRSLYLDFKQNAKFHQLHKSCVGNAKYSMTRLMDPDNPKSSRQTFYSSSILELFDTQYVRKKPL